MWTLQFFFKKRVNQFIQKNVVQSIQVIISSNLKYLPEQLYIPHSLVSSML